MELSIDILEIARLPFSKLETLYFSVGVAVTPKGRRINSRVAIGKPNIKFKPNRFKFHVGNKQKSSTVLILYNYRTDGSNYPIAIISIPLTLLEQKVIIPINICMKPLIPMDVPPIVKMEVVLTRNVNLDRSTLRRSEFEPGDLAPYIVKKVDDETGEEIMYPGLGSFGQLTPPSYITKAWLKLFKNCDNQELLKELFVDDPLRAKVMASLREFYQSQTWLCISDCVKCDSKKHKTNDACVCAPRAQSVEANYVSTNSLEFEMPLTRSKSMKKANVTKVKQHTFHVRHRSVDSSSAFNPVPPKRDDELPNPRRTRIDDVEDPIRTKKSADDGNLPDITRLRHYVVQHKPKNDDQKRILNESPPKQLFTRTMPVKHPETVQSKKASDIEISKPMIRGQQPQGKKGSEAHEKPTRALLQKIVVEQGRHESPPGKMRRGILPETANITPQKSLVRGVSSLSQKKPDEMEVKPPGQLSPMATRPKPPTETGVSPRRTRNAEQI